ncbi:hypothetical protein OA2633_00035 [Oceanicaulis alexandrii HTCC2633]|uniref:hypothetical protein n=1 Tax=Oceanicaulis sp. HTCC2633 TaxID=314254 RepID=UPI0000668C7E|nr:hypothetical protein [Oceanicaulis sp. HTCC2633]EAP88632.1 hypothetical protein OA2633_00035 [Oceanicaulis alexandrii HTCC2633] [Oceanicaulis sp. HTCC2633]
MTPTVNRTLKNAGFDHIDHALGRPVDPMADTYRDYYALNADSQRVTEFAASPHWERGSIGGGVVVFHVTDAGRKALAEHLKSIADPWRLYAVTFQGFTTHVSGKSHSCAKYGHYLDIADALSDLTFGEYLKGARCRLVAPTGAAA